MDQKWCQKVTMGCSGGAWETNLTTVGTRNRDTHDCHTCSIKFVTMGDTQDGEICAKSNGKRVTLMSVTASGAQNDASWGVS